MNVRKIRVLHVITRFLKWGGADKNTYDSIRALDPQRYAVDLAVGREAHLELIQGYEHGQIFQISALVRDPNPALDVVALVQLFRLITRNSYDVVHTHTGKAGVLGRLAARLAKTPLIVHSLHGTMSSSHPALRWLYLQLDRFTGNFTDYFVSVGEDLKQRHLRMGVGTSDKYRVIHSGMDLDAFYQAGCLSQRQLETKREELGLAPHTFVVGSVAALEARKGHKYTLQAAKTLLSRYHKLQFVLVGQGELEHTLRQWVRQNGLGERIIFAGYRDDVAEVMATFDLFLLTSLWEGLPQVLVQAAAVGKPIVTFAVEGACEVVSDGLNGFVVQLGDVASLTNRLNQLIADPDKARAMGTAGKGLLRDQWSTEVMMAKTQTFYGEITTALDLKNKETMGGAMAKLSNTVRINKFLRNVLPSFVLRIGSTVLQKRKLRNIEKVNCDPTALCAIQPKELTSVFNSRDHVLQWNDELKLLEPLGLDKEIKGGINLGDRRALYCLIRWFKPVSVLEIGTHVGASTSTIALALRKIATLEQGYSPSLTTVDIRNVNDLSLKPWREYGVRCSPAETLQTLQCDKFVQFVTDEAVAFFQHCTQTFDFIFLDGDHDATAVYQEIPRALSLLSPGGIVLLHDVFPSLRPLWSNGALIPGPWLAMERLRKEGVACEVLPLGKLPWPTKLGSNLTSLALLRQLTLK